MSHILQERCCVVHIPYIRMVKFKFLAQFSVDHQPIHSCQVLSSFCTDLLDSAIMWWIVSSLSPHNLHLLFYYVLSILALIWLVLIALFCTAIQFLSLDFPFLAMTIFSRARCSLLVTYGFHRFVFFFLIFVFWFLSFCWSSCCQYCF